MSEGSRTSSWRRRNGAQAAISSGSGSRFSGGRHFTTLVMKTSSRRQPIEPRRRTRRSPARPTKGRPSRSSFIPGPSPTKTTSVLGCPSPGTARFRPSWRRQRVHARTSAAIASSAARRSASVTPVEPPRSDATPPGPTRADEDLGDLDGVRGRALADVVGDHPEGDAPAAGDGRVGADAADVDLVVAGRLGRQRVDVGGRVVTHDDAGHGGEELAGAGRADRLPRLHVDRLRVAHEDGDAHGGAGDPQVRQVEDLAGLGDDLPLLLRVPVLQEDVDLRQGVEGDRMRVDPGLLGLPGDVGPDLRLELGDRLAARSRDRLVGVDDDPLQADRVAQRHERRHQLHRGAVRVGDDPLVGLEVVRVDLAHDQRDARLHPPGAGVVDDRAAAGGRLRRQVAGGVAAGREEGDVDAVEGLGRRLLDLHLAAAERQRAAGRARRGEEADLPDREARAPGGPGPSSGRRRRWRRRRRR